jgi:hypothetical protein
MRYLYLEKKREDEKVDTVVKDRGQMTEDGGRRRRNIVVEASEK